MPRNRYQELLRYLHFVSNDSINVHDKLAKIRPLISMVGEEFVKIEPEEYNSVDKAFFYQTIQSEKTKKVGYQKSFSSWNLWFYV